MSRLTLVGIDAPSRHQSPTADGRGEDISGTVLQVAVNIVFGAPFLWGLLVAVRGRDLWHSHRLFGDTLGRATTSMWLVVAASGALWLGVSLMLRPAPRLKTAGVLLVALACGLVVTLGR
jgi:hypothetical protein